MAYTNNRTVLNDMVASDIERNLKAGATFKHAVEAAGVSVRAAYRWLEWGEAYESAVEAGVEPNPDHEAFAEFRVAVELARNSARVAAAGTIMRAVLGDIRRDREGNIIEIVREPDWKAALAWLERQDPAEWGRRNRPEEADAHEAEDTLERAIEQARQSVAEAAEEITREAAARRRT